MCDFLAPLWAVSFGILALYMSRHGAPPLFVLSRGLQYVDHYGVRAEKTTSLPRQRPTAAIRALFYGTAVLPLTVATAFANKDVLCHVVFFLLLTRLYLGDRGLKGRHVTRYLVLGLASVFLFYRLYLLDRSTGAVLALLGNYLVDRLLAVDTQAHAYIVQIFPREHPFFDGQALGNPGGRLPFTPVDLAQYLGYRTLGRRSNYASPSFS